MALTQCIICTLYTRA